MGVITRPEVGLDDKHTVADGTILVTDVQAPVRPPEGSRVTAGIGRRFLVQRMDRRPAGCTHRATDRDGVPSKRRSLRANGSHAPTDIAASE